MEDTSEEEASEELISETEEKDEEAAGDWQPQRKGRRIAVKNSLFLMHHILRAARKERKPNAFYQKRKNPHS